MDLIYLCGFFDDYGYKILLLNRLNMLHGKPVAVASMGTFSEGALSQKALKKRIFIGCCKAFGFRNMKWSVTSELELGDVKRNIGKDAECMIAEDLPRSNVPGRRQREYREYLDVVFLSRISPMKNLSGAIKCLKNLQANVRFTIYGPKEDGVYWSSCLKELDNLPSNICWSYKGDVLSEEVQEKLQQHEIFLFPTKGENYGHVIFEALSVGCIPVISDQTPWNIIAQRGAGYVLPITDEMEEFTTALEELARLSEWKKLEMSKKAVQIAREKLNQAKNENGYRTLFG